MPREITTGRGDILLRPVFFLKKGRNYDIFRL